VAWFEVSGPDAGKLQDFYAKLFDWKVDANNPMNYGMVEASEGGIPGGVGPNPDGTAGVTFYVQVADLQAALDNAEKLGGKTVNPPFQVPDGPELAHFTDPAGNFIGLMKVPS
jgi:hypothetical protein